MFASLRIDKSSTPVDALEVYLEAPPLTSIDDPLAYWNVRAQTDTEPALAQMALDFLSSPGTSLYRLLLFSTLSDGSLCSY